MQDLEAIGLLQDPARRALYEYIVATGREVGRSEAAEAVGLQRTLTAFHLDRLASAGMLEVAYRRLTGRSGPGAGRPAKVYRRAVSEHAVSVPPRDYARAAHLGSGDMCGMDPTYHLAVFNIGRTLAPLDSPQLQAFMDGLDPINALAEQAPGFVWRYTADGTNNATAAHPMGDDIIINFGVWQSREHLWDFVYRSQHLDFLRRRREWFQHLLDPFLVLWWVPAGHIPGIEEAVARLEHLQRAGPSPDAFTFREPFDAPSSRANTAVLPRREGALG